MASAERMTDAPTDRTRPRRHPERGDHSAATIRAILDAGLVAHVGFDRGSDGPVVLPMAYARLGDSIYVHGAKANRMLRRLMTGGHACLTVTLLDGLVLSRSAFHHSMNYRSVMVFGRGQEVTDDEERMAVAAALVDRMVPGRSEVARMPSEAELKLTTFVRFPLDEASAKVRSGPPTEEPADLDLGIWGGVVPIETRAADLVPDDHPGGGVPDLSTVAWQTSS